ncbi:MAG TPA: cytochrome c biogenesis protein CcdA [Anaerolineae bacterium]|nr:cytochrome c biogenesis protein CcdA [Anaerolineae bacterium]
MTLKEKAVSPSPSVRSIVIVAAIALVTMALAVYYGLIHPHAPMVGMTEYLPAVTLGTVVLGGLIDGINPCAFTVLLLFVTAMLATLQADNAADINAARTRIFGMGSIYIASVFLTYLALGVGLLATSALFSRFHAPARIGALLAIGMGLWMLKDVFLPTLGPRLAAPKFVGQWTIDSARKATLPALIIGGILIGLCTVPCSGAVYLAVLSLLSLQSSALVGFAYLILYNLMFILPLVALLIAASARPTLNRLAHWNLHHKEGVRLALGASVVGMGLLILATV